MSYLNSIIDPHSIITPIANGLTYPEKKQGVLQKYQADILLFKEIVLQSESSAQLLDKIRDTQFPAPQRMTFLKLFRRCVALVCDTEATKKINTPTSIFVDNYGHTFKNIAALKEDFLALTQEDIVALAMLVGEYDDRGQQGYALTRFFFEWFRQTYTDFTIDGPIGAGPDIELSSILPDFTGSYPCDFVIHDTARNLCAVGFARYDSTRGGAQSDDRTGGNKDKVSQAKQYFVRTGRLFKLLFVSDGPGLTHKDTWEEACKLDDSWEGKVRVAPLRLASSRITREWLTGA
ncbi:MAG: hypothetical protein OCC46_08080 [Pseudodesulfovibrio sp.]